MVRLPGILYSKSLWDLCIRQTKYAHKQLIIRKQSEKYESYQSI